MKFYGEAKLSEVSWNLAPPPRHAHEPGGQAALAWHAEQSNMGRRRQLYRAFCVAHILINAGLMFLPLQVYAWMPVVRNLESFAVLLYSAALLVLLYVPNLPCRCISIGANFGLGVITLLGIFPSLIPPIMFFDVAKNGDWAWLILYPAWMLVAGLSVYFAPLLIRLELTLAQAPLAPGTVVLTPGSKPVGAAPVASKWVRFWQGLILLPLTIHFASTPYQALLEWNHAGAGTVVEVICSLGIAAGFIGFMYSRSPFRLLTYGASCYFAISNCMASLVHLILMPRTSENRFMFALLADPGGWIESGWRGIWMVLVMVTIVKAVRLLQVDLDKVTGASVYVPKPQVVVAAD